MPRITDRTNGRNLPQWGDMQGLVLSGYPHLDQAAYLVYTIEKPHQVRAWLDRIVHDLALVTSAFKSADVQQMSPLSGLPMNVNVAFTVSGLEKLGGKLTGFSDAFTRTIHGRRKDPSEPPPPLESHRSRILGDIGDNRPDVWRWGGPENDVDMLVMLYAHEDARLDDEIAVVGPPPSAAACRDTIVAEPRSRMPDFEPFGFRDGISQPILQGTFDADRFPDSIHITALGEFVIGYADAAGMTVGRFDDVHRRVRVPSVGDIEDFGRNGTYLVLRHLQQHVEEFKEAMADLTTAGGHADPDAAERLASKIVGRRKDGTPLVPYATKDDNEFGYGDDPYGYGCPMGSHVRRANPRDSFDNSNLPRQLHNEHRILRRGRPYRTPPGTPDEGRPERGLAFLCLNADIERQFEFIQQNWINNTSFLGLSDEEDPLIGSTLRREHREGTLTIDSVPAAVCVRGLPRFVTVRGGGYFFLPGMTALKRLARHA